MLVLMPLFQFAYVDDVDYKFTDRRFSIRSFRVAEIPSIDLFSAHDRQQMGHARWAIVADTNDLSKYENDINLLIMAFRILSDDLSPFIKYRLSPDASFCSIIHETMTNIHIGPRMRQIYRVDDLSNIDNSYSSLKAANETSGRLHNACYFLYRAFHNTHWVDSFLFFMSALEAVFSKDSKGGATATICRRVSKFLNDPTSCSYDDVNNLYDIRSRIVHGDLRASDDPAENLRHLKKLERLTIHCFRKLIAIDGFAHFKDRILRDNYLSALDS